MRSRLILILLSAFALPVLLPNALFAQSNKVFVSSSSTTLSWFPVFLAKQKGFYKDEKLDVDFVIMNNRLALQALVTGDLAYTTAVSSVVRGALRGLPMRVIMTFSEQPNFALIAKPGISSVEGLRTKILGVTSFGAGTDTMARALLQKFKLKPAKDVQIIAVGPGMNRIAALKTGLIDAALIEAPHNLVLQKEGFTNVLFVGDHIHSPYIGFGATLDRIQKYQNENHRLVSATLRGIEYAKKHRQESASLISKWVGMEYSLAEGSFDMVAKTWLDRGVPTAEGLNSLMEDLKSELKLESLPTPSQVFDWRYVQK
jgi:ABC-type nitrate/sulfonate/bicarbonate transport system substrate-binding protein